MTIDYSHFFAKSIRVSGFDVFPVVEGGKGVAVSDGFSSGAFAAANAVGTFSGVNAKLINDNGDFVPLVYKSKTILERHNELIEYSIKAGFSQARIASQTSKGQGPIHMNVLWEIGGVQKVLHGILEKSKGLIHGITCGAGMPYKLANIASQYGLFYYPIVSSMRAFRALWKRSYHKNPDLLGGVVYEDPWLAGGHNGITRAEDPQKPENPFLRLSQIREYMNEVGLNKTPIIIAGGVWYLRDWLHYFNSTKIAPVIFQFGTRPLLTKESPISPQWKRELMKINKGDVVLNKFSPTGFYSSAIKNNFIKNLAQRSSRQLEFQKEKKDNSYDLPIKIGSRGRVVYVNSKHYEEIKKWKERGFFYTMKTPDNTVIFVTEEEAKQIRKDQTSCMGCLSHCKFSSWKDTEQHNTGNLPDPRSFCIQKTLQNIISGHNVNDELMFAGHNVYKFSEDPFYNNQEIPSVKDLVQRIVTGN